MGIAWSALQREVFADVIGGEKLLDDHQLVVDLAETNEEIGVCGGGVDLVTKFLEAALAAASHSGVEKASRAGLSLALMKSKRSVMAGYFEFEGGGQRRAPGSGRRSGGLFMRNEWQGVRGFAAGLLDFVYAARDDAAFAAVEQGGFLGDEVLLVGLQAGQVESAPAERLAGLDDFVEALAFAFAHERIVSLRAEVGAHDFQQGVAAAAHLRGQPLADDPAQGVGQTRADLLLLLRSRTCRGCG